MKYSIVRWTTSIAVMTAAVLLIAGIPAVVQAQTVGMRVSIPFAFHVGSRVLPPGSYQLWPTGSGGAISMADGKGHSVSVLTNPAPNRNGTAAETAVVFNVYGGKDYFLSLVRWNGYANARQLQKSATELEIARNLSVKPATETIAAK